MEILATGEKIRRARIYKGLTLKDLCGDKLSVSKLSCIENDKIQAEPETLQYISEKLDISYNHLIEGIRTQIENNIKTLLDNKRKAKDYEELIEYNLQYAIDNEYYDLAFQLMHVLVIHYLEQEERKKVEAITSKYYDICSKSGIDENRIIYNRDLGKYFFVSKEYSQAIAYYSSIRKQLTDKRQYSSEELALVLYDEISCHMSLKSFGDAMELGEQLISLIEKVDNSVEKGQMYQIMALLYLRVDRSKFNEYEKKTYESYDGDSTRNCWAIFDFASCMFELRLKDEAIDYIDKGLMLCQERDELSRVKYLISCVGVLVENNFLDKAQSICDEASNIAIMLDNIRFIEKTYYYKAVILQKRGDYVSAEMYMNLSMDALFKCGNKHERYARYIEMGNMYHKLGHVNDSIKYLSLAMLLEKKL